MLIDPVVQHMSTLKDPRTGERRNHVVLYGAETHICVKQTALDLLDRGYVVHLVIDCVSSLKLHDRNTGVAALIQAGVKPTTF